MSSGGAVDERFKEIPVADETEKEIRENSVLQIPLLSVRGCRRL